MTERYAPIQPYASGSLDVGNGQLVYWEMVGNPDGVPAVYLHGGPGTGASAGSRRIFDPTAYRAVLFDQRGCGRTRPLADQAGVDLTGNTTATCWPIPSTCAGTWASTGGWWSAARGE